MLQEEPGERNGEMGERGSEFITSEAKITWDKLGPIKIYTQIMKQTKVPVNDRLEYGQNTKNKQMTIYGQALIQYKESLEIINESDEHISSDFVNKSEKSYVRVRENNTLNDYL